ncbi:ribosomal protein S16 [Neorickettsia helminthoeca str. Oregon]|uniref:Small ribosomal subunit protein bS16 n=1 Tax=Neorickettsia helminthoeca str. Oregon TaxID=1286528 RepID=X5H3F6_9RICK|nr:ribosomal protein S16 [Neorickettsia helminthoeca str. Oregon]
MLKIRLARFGRKNRPYYKIVVANSSAPRDGKFLEQVGSYDPLLSKDNPLRVLLNKERIQYWTSVGAKPTERVSKFVSSIQE